jgi:hypothetical protein
LPVARRSSTLLFATETAIDFYSNYYCMGLCYSFRLTIDTFFRFIISLRSLARSSLDLGAAFLISTSFYASIGKSYSLA